MNLRDIDFPAKDVPLKEDVHILGDMVGKVIREQGGDKLFRCVEAARAAAIRLREGATDHDEALEATLAGLTAEEAAEVVRAFSAYFQVVNLAERVHRIRRGRDRSHDPDHPQPGSLADTAIRLKALNVAAEEVVALFAASRVEPVFTAHPTEATRRIILEKQERIARELIGRLDPSRTPHEERVALARIREDITTAWQTDESPSERPTVADEREHVLYYVARVLYRVAPALHERLEEALSHEYGDDTRSLAAPMPPLLRIGSWVGGDMDGNPNVDAATIRATLDRHRELALDLYEEEVSELARQLSQSASRIEWSEDLERRSGQYQSWFPDVVAQIPARHGSMGYRVFLLLVRERLRVTRTSAPHGYEGPDQFLADVECVAASLAQHNGGHAGLFGVRRLVRRVATFGFHLASLDVRQDARELRDVMAAALGDSEWPQRTPRERAVRLHELLMAGDAVEVDRSDPRVRRALDVFVAIAEGRAAHGPEALGPFIISMAQDVDDVLTVLWLSSLTKLGEAHDMPLDIVPLLETVPDLQRSEEVLDALFTDSIIGPHVERRARRQMVMVGYSDSNKDGGIAAARWALQEALEAMARAAIRHSVRLTVFHGRGGTVSRGGGSVERAVAAMPAASIGGRLRLTEQGEVIDAKYGLPQIALRNFERMLGSIVLREAKASAGVHVPAPWVQLGDTVARTARATYRGLVYEDPRFTPYFRSGTPIDVIERMAIGSRPASRRSGAGVEDLRAIPWVFSWTQCRAMLTGWFGLGSGLEIARGELGLDVLHEAAAEWPFFDALLADVEMVLAKADLGIARSYVPLVPSEFRPVFDVINEEFERTVEHILTIRGTTALLDREPALQRSIRLRNPYVDPMNVLQVDLLKRWRAGERREGPLLEALLATVNGIARGLQNTG